MKPKSLEETRTNKWVDVLQQVELTMRDIEVRRDNLASRGKRPEFVAMLDKALEVLDKVQSLGQVEIIVDELAGKARKTSRAGEPGAKKRR